MELTPENIQQFIPYYLSAERQKGLVEELKKLPLNANIFANLIDPEPLQGDGWSGLRLYQFETGRQAAIKGVILTNSCDMTAENNKILPSKIAFAPLLLLDMYRERLVNANISPSKIADHLADIRAQKINSILYLPASGNLAAEHMVLLSDIHSIPVSEFKAVDRLQRIFSLNNTGFYLFVFKLAVHLCRMHEGIDREAAQH
jgi:hypothetical protein